MNAGAPPALACPSCNAWLTRAHQRYGLFACHGCGGIWADLQASNELARAADHSVSAVSQYVSNQARQRVQADVPWRPCPACRRPMLPTTFGQVSLDSCTGHGTWFDRDELTRVMAEVERRPPPPPASSSSSGGSGSSGDSETGAVVAVGVLEVLFEIVAGLAD